MKRGRLVWGSDAAGGERGEVSMQYMQGGGEKGGKNNIDQRSEEAVGILT